MGVCVCDYVFVYMILCLCGIFIFEFFNLYEILRVRNAYDFIIR